MKYRNEEDRCYGVAGMVAGLSLMEAHDLLAEVNIERPPGESIRFTPDFYFAGNPRLSASKSWRHIMGHFRVLVALAVANALCRRMVLEQRRADSRLHDSLLEVACADAMDYCQLERDEVTPIFDEMYDRLTRLFADPQVRRGMTGFAAALRERRTLSSVDVMELMQELSIF